MVYGCQATWHVNEEFIWCAVAGFVLCSACLFIPLFISVSLDSAPVQVLRHAGQLWDVFESGSPVRLRLVRAGEEVFAETGVCSSREHLDAPQCRKQSLCAPQNQQGSTRSHSVTPHLTHSLFTRLSNTFFIVWAFNRCCFCGAVLKMKVHRQFFASYVHQRICQIHFLLYKVFWVALWFF